MPSIAEKERARVITHITIDFNQPANMMEKKGLLLQVIECPACGGKIDTLRDGSLVKCRFCGKDVYAVDIFEKFKSFLGT